MHTVSAQTLYDLREQYAFCSGTDLHEFFAEQVGEPSPSGHVEVSLKAAARMVSESYASMMHNSPSMAMQLEQDKLHVLAAL